MPQHHSQVHGSLRSSERARLGSDYVDFAVNCNPYGPPDAVVEAVRRARLDRYPDQCAESVREHWGDQLGLETDSMAIGNGGVELIWAACRAFLGPERALMVIGPTFTEAITCARAMGAPHFVLRHGPTERYELPAASLVKRVEEAMKRAPIPVGLVYVCTPNNPTGSCLDRRAITELLQALRPAVCLLDRSFETLRMPGAAEPDPKAPVDFRELMSLTLQSNCLELRSFTKDFGLPGLRLGALFGPPAWMERCQRQLPPWNVSAPAVAGALALTQPTALLDWGQRRAQWWNDARAFRHEATALGHPLVPSCVPFALLPVGHGARVRAEWMRHGVHVRDCASFGLPQHIRLAARPAHERERLLDRLHELSYRPRCGDAHAEGERDFESS